MRRRNFLALGSAGVALAGARKRPGLELDASCGCDLQPQAGGRGGAGNLQAFANLQSGIKITGVKVFGVSLTPNSDRPYVFVKLETNQGLVGWGEGTLEAKGFYAVMACVSTISRTDFLIGADPMQVEHIWQSMYVHSFYRAGPVLGSAISGIDQALWDIRGKVLGKPVYQLLGGPFEPRGVRGYYHVDGATRDQLTCRFARRRASRALPALSPEFPDMLRMDRAAAENRSRDCGHSVTARNARSRYRHRRRFPCQDKPGAAWLRLS